MKEGKARRRRREIRLDSEISFKLGRPDWGQGTVAWKGARQWGTTFWRENLMGRRGKP